MKIKGLSGNSLSGITIDDLLELINKDSTLESKQNKWYKDLSNGNITIKEQIYTLKVTGNKRDLVYINSKLNNTEPLFINENSYGEIK
jgi:hypothetical protein